MQVHSAQPSSHPLTNLPPEDLDLVTRLVLHSGSIKDLAAHYDVSYPTIRGRLDKVIARLQAILEGRKPDPFNELLASLIERGELSVAAARQIQQLQQVQLQQLQPPQLPHNAAPHATHLHPSAHTPDPALRLDLRPSS